MNATRQRLVRYLIATKRTLDAAEKAFQDARNAYRLAETLYLKGAPIPGQAPSDVYCDPYFISVTDEWRRPADYSPRLEFFEAERCPTSE